MMFHRKSAGTSATARQRFGQPTRRFPKAFVVVVGFLGSLGLIWILVLSNFMSRGSNSNADNIDSSPSDGNGNKVNDGRNAQPGLPQPNEEDDHGILPPDNIIENVQQRQARLMIELDRCAWMKDLLQNGKHIGQPLPEPGKSRAGGSVFWLKRPLMHTINPDTNEEIMLLRYNVYNPTQHTNKWTNTVDVLTKHQGNRLFPKLHGFCRDLDGFHSLAVEYLPFDMPGLPIPGTLDKCVDRAQAALKLFSELDEMGLALVDFKRGQWMARIDNSLVLQDIDDIVQVPSTSEYTDQIDAFEDELRRHHKLSKLEMNIKWGATIFPNALLTIRYDVFGTSTLLDDLGFRWGSSACAGYDNEFAQCKKRLTDWSKTLDDDWPAPNQLVEALGGCLKDRDFGRTERQAKPWHAVKMIEKRDYKAKSACAKAYDKRVGLGGGGGDVVRCDHSCCRAKKGYGQCYYTVDTDKC